MIQISPMRPRRIAVAVVVSALAQLAPTTPATAVTYTWDGEFNTQWDHISLNIGTFIFETNWNNEGTSVNLPTVLDSVLFTGNVPYANAVNLGATRLVSSATFSSSNPYGLKNGVLVTLFNTSITNSGVGLSSTSGLSAGGNLTLDNGTLSSPGGAVSVGGGADGTFGELVVTDAQSGGANGGLIRVINGGDLYHDGGAFLGKAGEYGYVDVTGVGSTWTNTGQLVVGDEGTGVLSISGGGQVTDTTGYLGYASGSKGTVFVNGAGSTWTNSHNLFVGYQDTSLLDIANGGSVHVGDAAQAGATAGWLTISDYDNNSTQGGVLYIRANSSLFQNGSAVLGDQAGESGFVKMSEDAAWTNTGDLYIGKQGVGVMTVTSGSSVHVGNAALAGAVAGEFTVSSSSPFTSGHLYVQNGSSLTNEGNAVIAQDAGEYGQATVTGTNSMWQNTGNIRVADAGTGSLTIGSGGQVITSGGTIGQVAGSTGTVDVTGAGSKWTNTGVMASGQVTVGFYGNGTLNILAGGEVTTLGPGLIGFKDGADGLMVVNGTNSKWDSAGFLSVGHEGVGTLNVLGGASVRNSDGVIGEFQTSAGSKATVSGAGSSWTSTGYLRIGNDTVLGTGMLQINTGGSVHVGDAAEAGATAGWLTVSDSDAGGALSSGGHLYIQNGSTLTNSGGALLGDETGEYGYATLSGNSKWINIGDVYVGGAGTGNLTIQPGSTVHIGDTAGGYTDPGQLSVGGQSLDGKLFIQNSNSLLTHNGNAVIGEDALEVGRATVSSNASWVNTGSLTVGENGIGYLRIESGGSVTDTNGYLGRFSTLGYTGGTATVTGNGSRWTNTNNLYVGSLNSSGSNQLTIENGGRVYVGDAASDRTNNGFVTISDADNTDGMGNGGQLYILNGSTLTHSGSALLGDQASEYGYASVDGAGSTWTNSSFVRVGNGGMGKLTISGGGRFEDTEGYLGFDPGASGTATITGTDSTWENSGALIVARKGTGSLTISDGGTATNTTGYLGTDAGGSGTATVTGTGSAWNNTHDLYVGRDGTGTLTIENGGTVFVGDAAQAGATAGYLTVSDSDVGGSNGGHLHIQNGSTLTHHSYAVLGDQAGEYGYATASGSGSTWNNDDFLFVGHLGSGTLRIESGAEVSNSIGYLGRYLGSTGTATVTGAGSTWTNSGRLYVGHAGTGDLNIQAGGKVSNGNADVGYNFASTVDVTGAGSAWNSSGFVSVSNGSTLTIADGGSVNIGDAAAPAGATNGWLTLSDHDASGVDGGKLSIVNNSTLTHHGHAALGAQSGEYGFATVSGAGSTWNSSGELYIGASGAGTLAIDSGGLVSNSNAFIADAAGSTGEVRVENGGTWAPTGFVLVGKTGDGHLEVTGGGTVSNTFGIIGDQSVSTSSALVTGNGSTWTNTDFLIVGNFGNGTLEIQAGGNVSNTEARIGALTGSTGSASVSGPGSSWTNTANLYVGVSGPGLLDVINDGSVDVGDTMTVYANGTVNLDGGHLDATTIDHTHGGAFNFTNGTLTVDTFQGSLVQDGGTLQIGGVGIQTTVITARDKLDDFDSYATGATNTATANVWNAEPSASPNSNIVTSDQGKSLQTLGGTAWSGAERDLSGTDAAVDVGETQTFFWQVKPSYTADGAGWDYDFMMGLSPDVNHINTVDAWTDFAVMPFINNEATTPFINASGPNSPWWTQINPGEWTNVWVVVNNDGVDPTYDLYIATEADPDTPILVSSDADWRGWDNTESMPIGPNMALNAIGFMAAGNPDTQFLIDNIWYSQDVNTSNPLTHPWTSSIEFTPETTTIQGDLTLSAGATMTFDIAGSGVNDLLNVTGALTADGTLQVLLESGVTLAEGDSFDLLDFGSAIGAFATLDLPDLSALGLTWDSTGLLTDGILSVVANILAGDLNADGFVGIADLNIVLGNWNQNVTPGEWTLGDPTGDGFVGIADLNTVLGNWNAGTPPTDQTNIPEPATLVFLLTALPTLTRRPQKPLAA